MPPLSTERLARLCAAVAPGSSGRRVRRLRGGLDGIVHAVELVTPAGDRRRLVVRRFPPGRLAQRPDAVDAEWRTLVALERLGVAAPRPVLADPDGRILGAPGLVMTRLRGRGLLAPRDAPAWTRQLGEALAAVHRAPTGVLDPGVLAAPGRAPLRRPALPAARRAAVETHPLGRPLLAALAHWEPRLPPTSAVLVHGDYWAGNTLWHRGRLTGVVDWGDARLDEAGADVGYCRMDLAMLTAGDAPDAFLRAYEAAAGRRLADVFFWDLCGAVPALPDPAKWLPGYHDLGRTDLTPAAMRARLDGFVAAALGRATGRRP